MTHHTPARIALALLFALTACDADDTCTTSDDCFRGEVCDQAQRRCAPPPDMSVADMAPDMTQDMPPDLAQDMAPDSAQDMAALAAPADLVVAPTPQGELELAWTAVPGAARYEVRIVAAGEDWKPAGVSPRWLDLTPPPVELTIEQASASDAVHLTHVQLDATASASAPERRYQVRALDAAGTPGQESGVVSGRLTAPTADQLAYQWSVVDGQATTPLAGATTPSWQDATAAEAGTPRTYQLAVTAPGGKSVEATVTGARRRPAILQLVAGAYHTCALLETARVRCWGDVRFTGLMGAAQFAPTSESGDLALGAPIIALGGNAFHTCAIDDQNKARCWGSNQDWQLGDPMIPRMVIWGDDPGEMPPRPVPLPHKLVKISGGAFHTCAISDLGAVYCWGQHIPTTGQLGDPSLVADVDGQAIIGNTLDDLTNIRPVNLDGLIVDDLSAGIYHTCASGVKAPRRITYCWGSNMDGQLGTKTGINHGARNTTMPPPAVAGEGVLNPVKLTVNGNTSCALLAEEKAICWGNGARGLLANGATTSSDGIYSNSRISPIDQAVDRLALGAAHACARVKSDRSLRCWGGNNYGQLGLGSIQDLGDQPEEVVSSFPALDLGGARVEHIALGERHTCAALEGGEVRCWGDNSFGQLGLPAAINQRGHNAATLPNDPAFNVPLLKK